MVKAGDGGSAADPPFLRGEAPIPRGEGANLSFGQISLKTAWKLRKFYYVDAALGVEFIILVHLRL